jgi:serine/threonine protein kinase
MSQKYREGDEPIPGSGYRLTDFLGRGGFGEVWKASAPGGAEAALKIIQLGGTEGRKEFRALQLVKKIRHTHLVPIFSFWLKNAEGQVIDDALIGTDETFAAETKPAEFRATMAAPPMLGRPQATELIIAMGLGDRSLFDRLQECVAQGREGIPQEELLHYLEDAAEAIDFLNRPLHNLGSGPVAIQHCDIKPHNLMIVGGGAQVCDFGLARMMGTDRTTTAAASIAYAAPECLVEGKPSDSTDQYSLAVTYYELKTGVLPYRDEAMAQVMDAKRQGKLDFSKVSSAEQAVLRRATSQNPPERFSSALDMVNSLKRAASSGTDVAETKIHDKRPRRGRRTMVIAVPLLLAILVGALVFANRDRLFKRQEAEPIERPKTQQIAGNPTNNSGLTTNTNVETNVPKNHDDQLPENPAVALIQEAKSQLAANQWQAAFDKCQEALLLDARQIEGYFVRGQCSLKREPPDFDKAIEDFEKAKSLSADNRYRESPDFAAAYLGRGTARLGAKRFDEAIDDFLEAGRYDRNDYRIFSRLGAARLSLGQFRQAVDAFDVALNLNSTQETDNINRGKAYLELGNVEKARDDFVRAAELDPKNADTQLRVGNAEIDLKRPLQAIKAFGNAINILSQSPAEAKKLAHTYLARGGASIQLAEGESPGDADGEKNYLSAIDDFTAAGRLFGLDDVDSSVELHTLRASCFEKLKRRNEAKEDQQIADSFYELKAKPGDAESMNTIAYYLSTSESKDIRDIPKAIIFASKACEIGGNDAEKHKYFDTLATAYAAAGQFDRAVEWESKAVENAPESESEEYRSKLERFKKGEK